MERQAKTDQPAAYGGRGWRPRAESLQQEIGTLWRPCGLCSEWTPLREVLLHRPGNELEAAAKPDAVQMLAPVSAARAQGQHDTLARAYENLGIKVSYLEPARTPPPNQMFMADLFFMTPEGAILARPASVVRAGEERLVARKLAELGIPILRTVRGTAVFEAADAAWINSKTVMVARGLRTNTEGTRQVAATLNEMGVAAVHVDLPQAVMHLMGILRFVDRNLALAWPNRLSQSGAELLRHSRHKLVTMPDDTVPELIDGFAMNFVTLGPREILMPSGNPKTRSFIESLDVTCHCVAVDELAKAAGAVGCLTGILRRDTN